MNWRDAVLASFRSFSLRHGTRSVDRQQFLSEELPVIVAAVGSRGRTPHQTLSRILQELRDGGLIEFLSRGQYLLLDTPIDVTAEDFTDEAIDVALRANRLVLGTVETGEDVVQARRRRGQDRVRVLTRASYGDMCAVCDVADIAMLIASHIVTWAEAPEHRGDLSNVICLCRIHDALFERGYWSLGDDLTVLKRRRTPSAFIGQVLDLITEFRPPVDHRPTERFLQVHRDRHNF